MILSVEKQILYLMTHADEISIQELIRIYQRRGYSAQYIRNVMSHLKKEQYVIVPERSAYQITKQGREFVESINRKPHRFNCEWDGAWQVVMVEVPESERKIRDRFRSDLLQLGFGALYKSVYISPWDHTPELERLVHRHQLANNMTVFVGEVVQNPITSRAAQDVWNLADLGARYAAVADWFHNDFQPRVASFAEGADALDLFVAYLELGEVISDLSLSDPMLPIQLLPPAWNGRAIFAELTSEFSRLAQVCPKDSPYRKFMN